MFQGLDVGTGSTAAEICRRSAQAGLLIETAGPNDEVVKVMAPLTTPESLLNRGLDILEESVAAHLPAAAL
jgi:diaminobutyrate-2-oxoglutarate transaminase